MNPQPAPADPNAPPNARIDQVLSALRTAEPPAGLEQRIAARLAQAAQARTQSASSHSAPSYASVILTLSSSKGKDPCSSFAPAKFYSAAALTVIIALTTLTILHRRNAPTTAQTITNAQSNPIAQSQSAAASLNSPELQSRHNAPATNPALAAEAIPHPPSPSAQDPSTQDPDAIALAETLAPSRPAPPMPVTAQEKLIQAATRPGQPIQLAELDLARAPHLHAAAQAREHASIESYVKSLLAPFAVADALQPTTFSQPQEAPTSAPAEPASNPSSN